MVELEQTKAHVRDAVALLEQKDDSRLVDMADIATLVRSLGVNPTGTQINIMMDQLAALNEGIDRASNLIPMEHIVCAHAC
jgi:hypothetical protein